MALGPGSAVEARLVAQQELREPVACSHQVGADVLAGADQVAKRLLGRFGDPDRVELSGEQQADQVLGVAAIGLHLLARPSWDLPRRCDHALDPGAVERPGEAIAGRPRLIARPHRPFERAQEPHHRSTLATEALKAQLAGFGVKDRRDHLRGMHIKTHQGPSLRHVGALLWSLGRAAGSSCGALSHPLLGGCRPMAICPAGRSPGHRV